MITLLAYSCRSASYSLHFCRPFKVDLDRCLIQLIISPKELFQNVRLLKRDIEVGLHMSFDALETVLAAARIGLLRPPLVLCLTNKKVLVGVGRCHT